MREIKPSDAVRAVLRDALHARKISQRDLARRLSDLTGETWTQSRIHKVLAGYVELRFDDLAHIAQIADLSLVELCRQNELVADLTPTELRLVNTLRDNPQIMLPLVDVMMKLAPPAKPRGARTLYRGLRRGRLED